MVELNTGRQLLIFIEKLTAIVYIIFILGSALFSDHTILLGVILGGALGLINIDLFRIMGDKVFAKPEKPNISYIGFYWVKIVALVFIIFITLRTGYFHPISFLVGFSDFVFGLTFGSIIWAWRSQKASV